MCTSGTQHIPNVSYKLSKRKIDFSTIPVSPTSPILNTRNRSISIIQENISPVLNSRKKEQNYLKTECLTSPVLHTKRRKSSPVLNSKEIIKLRKQGILESNRKINCVRKLQYEINSQELMTESIEEANKDILLNIQSVDDFDKKFTLNFKTEHIKEPVENNKPINQSIFNDNFNYKKRKRKRNYRNYHKKIKTCDDEKIEIESVCSQEIANKIENSIIGNLQSPRNILKNISINKSSSWNLKSVVEDNELCSQNIEIINSQEIRKPSEIYATKFEPREGIIEELSQNSFTPISTIIETDLSQTKPEEKIVIEESQSSSSALTNISNCTVVQDSFEKSSNEYIWSPVKKKKYKPGTYSHKFQRILRKQKANTAIWKHELYLANSKNYQIPESEEDLKVTIVEICKINTDYGMNIFECIEVSCKEKCLIIADLSQLLDVVVRIKDWIKIFPPFLIQYFRIDKCDIKTFVNVHKVLKCT